MVSTCNYVKKNVDGIKQFSYLSCIILCSSCGRFVVYCLMRFATMDYSGTKRKSIAFWCLDALHSQLISFHSRRCCCCWRFYDDVQNWRMFFDTNVKFLSKQTLNGRFDALQCATGYNNDIVCISCDSAKTRRRGKETAKQQWIMTIITSNGIDVAHQTYVAA